MTDQVLRDRISELEQQIAELTAEASSMRVQAESLQAASVVTSDSSEIGQAIRKVLIELRKVVPYDSASVQELRENRLVIVGGVGFADLEVLLGESFEIDNADSPNGEVVHRRRAFIVADTEKYRAFRRGLHVGAGIRSWLGVPLIYHEQLLGILALDKSEADFYTAEHQRLALGFAAIVASAMHPERLSDQYSNVGSSNR